MRSTVWKSLTRVLKVGLCAFILGQSANVVAAPVAANTVVEVPGSDDMGSGTNGGGG